MAKVRLLVYTGFNGKALKPGMEETVDELTAQRWEKNRIATIISTEPKVGKEVIVELPKKVIEEKIEEKEIQDEKVTEEEQTPDVSELKEVADQEKEEPKKEELSLNLTKAELIEIAVEKGLEVNDRMTKPEILAKIQA